MRPRITAITRDRVTNVLEAMSLSVSDAIRLLMFRVADEQCLPFASKVPNSAEKKEKKGSYAIGLLAIFVNLTDRHRCICASNNQFL